MVLSSLEQVAMVKKTLQTRGLCYFLDSKKQPCVILLTTESQLLVRLGINCLLEKPVPIYADNNDAIALAANPKFHATTKHITIRFHHL